MVQIAKPCLGKEEIEAVIKVLESGMLAQGPKVREFEKQFAAYCGTQYAVALSNGTAALHTALTVAGIQEGDEIITTPFTFIATANAILMQKATPVFVDIDKSTFNIDPQKIEAAITAKTKAIIAVDLYGQPANYGKLRAISEKHNLLLIGDAAQSVGATYNKKKTGSLADISCFSFYATKNMTCGEGGMITTNNKDWHEHAKRFRHHGQTAKNNYDYTEIGYNYRMTDIQAVIAIEQLKKLEDYNKKRRENSHYLSEQLKEIPQVIIPIEPENIKHVFHQFTICIPPEKRTKIQEKLKAAGISTGVFYPKPLHFYKTFKPLGYENGDFPVAEKVCQEVLSLPIHPLVKKEELEKIVEIILEVMRGISHE